MNKSIDECEVILYKAYLQSAKRIEKELKSLYNEISSEGEGVLLSHLYQYNRYYDMLNNLSNELTALGNVENKLLEDRFIKLYEKNTQITEQYGNNSFKPTALTSNQIKAVVNSNWGDHIKTWSDSVWTHKSATLEHLQKDMVDFFSTGRSWNDLAKQLSIDMGVDFNCAKRLIRTEMNRISVESSIETYKKLGFDKIMYLTSHDGDVCSEECEAMDGKIINIGEAEIGINVPPLHPNCRCYIVSVKED